MAMLEKKKTIKDLSKVERELILRKPASECSGEEKDLKLELLEEKLSDAETPGFGNLGPDDLVVVTVPLMPDGNMFGVNGKKFFGKTAVKKRVADQLMMQISAAFRGERELLQHRGNANSTRMSGEHTATMEKYKELAGNGES